MNKRAIVISPVAPLMTAPEHATELDDEALFGMCVELTGEAGGGWHRVVTPYRYESWLHESHMLIDGGAADRWEAGDRRRVWHAHADVQAAPEYRAARLECLPMGAEVCLRPGEPSGAWTPVRLPDGREGWMIGHYLGPWYGYGGSPFGERELRWRIADTAMLYMGTQYRWGGKTPDGIDCSGLTSMACMMNGAVIYRNASCKEGFPMHRIEPGAAQKSDFILYPGHIMLYLGEGRYIHSTGRAGDDGVVINSLFPSAAAYRADIAEGLKDGRTWFASIF